MIAIDDNLLKGLGLGDLPEEERRALLAQIRETLELRVGIRLADGMSDAQLTEFESFIDSNDEKGAIDWLGKNYPDYPKVVEEELEKLRKEITDNAGDIKGVITGDQP